jgi:hypothetical protein
VFRDEECSMTRHLRWIVLPLLVAACGSASPTAAPSTPSSAAPPASGSAIQLNPAPANLGCDTVGVDYRGVTFHVDPTAADQVTALADTGTNLRTFWAAGFTGGTPADKNVLDPAGAVVVTDGDMLAIPPAAFPRLQGYFVCPSPDALYILAADPQ